MKSTRRSVLKLLITGLLASTSARVRAAGLGAQRTVGSRDHSWAWRTIERGWVYSGVRRQVVTYAARSDTSATALSLDDRKDQWLPLSRRFRCRHHTWNSHGKRSGLGNDIIVSATPANILASQYHCFHVVTLNGTCRTWATLTASVGGSCRRRRSLWVIRPTVDR